MNKIFNPKEWLTESVPDNKVTEQKSTEPTTVLEEVEEIISRLEEQRIDITQSYKDWINIGFAFSEEFGENGRELFHRVSAFHSKYDRAECDAQFSSCLKSKKTGVTIKSFFYLAKDAGIDISFKKSS